MGYKVVFLGAGASKDASYPLCDDIFKELKSYLPLFGTNYRDHWNRFKQFIDRTPILHSLYDEENDHYNVEKLLTEINELTKADQSNNINYDAIDAQRALDALYKIIDTYFYFKNYNYDSNKDGSLDYLHSMLKNVDSVITVNWDNLCELTLFKESKWFPSGGYGFNVHLTRKDISKEILLPPSPIKVLKLHGSIGWRKDKDKDYIYLRYYDLLRFFPIQDSFETCEINDDKEPKHPGVEYADSSTLMIYPINPKKYPKELGIIWDEARKSLSKATEVEIVGYSLPDTDSNLRDLIAALNQRIIKNEVRVSCIVGPDKKDEANRLRKLLGEKINIIKKTAKEYYK